MNSQAGTSSRTPSPAPGGEPVLFDVDAVELAPRERLSADRRRTQRQAEHLAAGLHPLTAALGWPVKLHADAAPADDRAATGHRCGGCRFRRLIHWHNRTYAKCVHGDDWPRATHGAGTDVRKWWPACTDFEHGDPRVGPDAARCVPDFATPDDETRSGP